MIPDKMRITYRVNRMIHLVNYVDAFIDKHK